MLRHHLKFLVNIFFCVIVLQNAVNVECEFYSSTHQMINLVQYEQRFVKHMQKFITENENKLDFLKARLTEFERERDEALETGAAYFESPVNQYLLNKRLTVDWARIENLMATNVGQTQLTRLDEFIKERRNFPNEEELKGAMDGFLRLQDIYRLKTEQMADGILQGVTYANKLEARHCFDIGKHALSQNKMKLAHSWLKAALRRLPTANSNDLLQDEPLEMADILNNLAAAQHKLGDLKGANETYTELLQLQPESEEFAKAFMEFLQETAAEDLNSSVDLSEEHEPIPADLSTTSRSDRYKLTCSGHIKIEPSEERDLRCGYLTETHPFLLIAPLKVEELNFDPLLVLYYDVISDSEIAIVKQLVDRKLHRSAVLGQNGSEVSALRTSHFAFIPKTVHPVLETIDQRVEDMTNLNMIYAEDHQFSNYGIGGHYVEHYDWFDMEQSKTFVSGYEMGNRIATVLFYLTDVEQGGGTAFPYLKRLLMPKKGSAAFWHNIHASGEPDERSLHGACPIIVGSKWVQNRWIREHDQSDRRPCELWNDKVFGPF